MPRPQVSGCEPVSGLYILRGGPDMSGPYSVAAKASPLGEGLGKLLLAVHGLVQGFADGTGTGDLGLEVRLDLVGQDGLGPVSYTHLTLPTSA